jgi:hypothetical protein
MNILGDGQVWAKTELLVNRGDTEDIRQVRREFPPGSTPDMQLAAVRFMNPGNEVDQRALAGAVLTYQRVNLSWAHVQANTSQHDIASERLGQPRHTQGGFTVGGTV